MSDEIKLVSERSEKEIAAQKADAELSWATRELVANLLRVIAGTGRTDQLINQMAALDKPYRKLLELYGGSDFLASGPMIHTLCYLDRRANDPDRGKKTDFVDRARDEIVKQSLRIVAAQLLGQRTQESQADRKLFEAIRYFEEARRPKSELERRTSRLVQGQRRRRQNKLNITAEVELIELA